MKYFLILFFLIIIGVNVFSQSNQAFRYQAIARNGSGNIIPNQTVRFKISLLQGGANGAEVYSEDHSATTNIFGLVNLSIGDGQNPTTTFSSIDWSGGIYFIKIGLDITGGSNFADMGSSQLLSVPYALYAASGNAGPQGAQGLQGAQGQQGIQGPAGTYSAGTGISLSGDVISNIAPDQTVLLHGSGATTVSGTYPDFTISSTDNNNTYSAGNGLLLSTNPNVFSVSFGTLFNTVAQGNHTHTQLHDQSHAMTSFTDHTASANKLFYSNSLGNVSELEFGTSGQVLSSTGTGTAPSWTTPLNAAVTSVGLSLPSIFTVTGAPVTASGTLAATFADQVANSVFAGPSSGSAAAPAFRALVANDIPTHNQLWSTITSTPNTIAGYGISDGVTTARTLSFTGTANQINFAGGTQNLSANSSWTVGLADNAVFPGNAAITVPQGTTGERPASATNGMVRYNSTTANMEFFENGNWMPIPGNASGLASGAANYLPKFDSNANLDTSILYQNGTAIGIGTTTPSGRFVIQGDAASNDSVPLFEVKDKNGATVFVVWPSGARFYVDNSMAKTSNRGSFAVSGKSSAKTLGGEFFSVNSDSISATKSLYIPRLSTLERDGLSFTPSEALIIFNMTDKCMQIYQNNVWSNIWCFNCAPAILIQPVDKTICSGSSALFNVSATGTSLTYQWQQSIYGSGTWTDLASGGTGPIYSGVNTPILSLLNVPVGYAGNLYRCIIRASCEPSVTSNAAAIYFGSPSVNITSHPSDFNLSHNCNASFSVSMAENGVTFQWQESTNGGTIWSNILNGGSAPFYTGSNTSTLTMQNASTAMHGYKYRCVVGNACGTGAISNPANLNALLPVAMAASNVAPNSFTALWMHISGTPEYFLDVSTSSDFSTFVSGYNNLNVAMSPSFSVIGLNPGTTYYYRVRSGVSCGSGYSLYSNTITVTTTVF